MKTIKPPPKQPEYKLECRNCKAVMQCQKEELKYQCDPRDGDAYVLVCPHCQKQTWFAVSALNKHEVWPEVTTTTFFPEDR